MQERRGDEHEQERGYWKREKRRSIIITKPTRRTKKNNKNRESKLERNLDELGI